MQEQVLFQMQRHANVSALLALTNTLFVSALFSASMCCSWVRISSSDLLVLLKPLGAVPLSDSCTV